MKKILILLTLFAGLIGCQNQKHEFEDFDYTSGYFPYQYPVRTLVLGDYIYDNTNDNNHKFLISAAMGGVYENTKERTFDIELAPDLCTNAFFGSTNDPIRLMPQNYYSLSSSSKLTIPAGKVNGNVEVQLTDAFFDDPLAIKLGYVIPLRIVNVTNLDTVLRGTPMKSNPDPRVTADWIIVPRDFTMFAVMYINQYHGNYLHRGTSILKNAAGDIIENNVYHQPYMVDDEIWKLNTTGKNQVSVSSTIHSKVFSGDLKMNLLFGNDGNCTITKLQGSSIPISGTGKFVKDGGEWGGKKRNSIILSYIYSVEQNFAGYDPPAPSEPIVTVDNNNPSIKYSGTWTHTTQTGAYGNTVSYSALAGSYYTFNFTGDGIAIYGKTGPYYGPFDVYLDNVKMATVSSVTPATTFQVKLFETTCFYGSHTLKVVLPNSTNTFLDYLVYKSINPPTILPNGTYTFEAQDTLVVRDRAVVMEVYNPVVSK